MELCRELVPARLIRCALLLSLATTLSGCVTVVTWRWATETRKTSDTIRAKIEALRQESGEPDLLVFRLSHVEGVEDGLYAVEIPAGWRSSPMHNRPRSYSYLFWLDDPLELEVKPVEKWTHELPAAPELQRWIRAHRRSEYPYYFGPYGPTPELVGRVGPGKVVILDEFEWPVREELAEPGRPVVATVLTPLTAALDLLPAFLLVLLFRAWRKRGPVRAAGTDSIACVLHLVGFLVTAVFIAATDDFWTLGWHVWGELLGVGGEALTIPWLVAVRALALVGAVILSLAHVRAAGGGVRRLRLAIASSSLALLAIPFALDITQGPEIATVQAISLIGSGAAAVLAVLAALHGVRPLWVTAGTFLPAVLLFLLEIYWGLLTAIVFLVPPH